MDRLQDVAMGPGVVVGQRQTVLVNGPIGVGNPFFLYAFGHFACRRNRRVRYDRGSRLLAKRRSPNQTGNGFVISTNSRDMTC